MRRIYLDWGVISYLKKDEYAELRSLLLSNKDRFFIVYSSAHLEDLMKSKGKPQFDEDVKMLSDLVEDHLLDIDKGVVLPYRGKPDDYCRIYVDNSSCLSQSLDSFLSVFKNSSILDDVSIDRIKSNYNEAFHIPSEFRSNELFMRTLPNLPESPTVRDVLESVRQFLCDMVLNPGSYKKHRAFIHEKGFKLEDNAGNWNDGEAVDKITLFFKSKGIDMSFNDYVMMSFHGRKFTINEFFTVAYCLLDMLGFHSDKLPKATNTVRSVTTDAKHAYMAGFCDWFITADTKLYHKAKALYSHFGVSTCVMTPVEAVGAIKEELLPLGQDYILSFIASEFIENHVIERHEKEHDSDADFVIYKFSHRFLGIFTHGIYYQYSNGLSSFQFKLAFDNYSRFLFYDEVGMIVDTITGYFGLEGICDYESLRTKFVEGNTDVTISWRIDNGFLCIKNDEERQRPELFFIFKNKEV